MPATDLHGAAADLDDVLRLVLARQFRVPPDELTGDHSLVEDLGMDDESARSLLTAVGDSLDASFPDDFLDGVRTCDDLTAAVRVAIGE